MATTGRQKRHDCYFINKISKHNIRMHEYTCNQWESKNNLKKKNEHKTKTVDGTASTQPRY